MGFYIKNRTIQCQNAKQQSVILTNHGSRSVFLPVCLTALACRGKIFSPQVSNQVPVGRNMKDQKIIYSLCLITIQDTLIGMAVYCYFRLQSFSFFSVGFMPCSSL